MLGQDAFALGVVVGQVDELEDDHAAGEFQGCLDGVGEADSGGLLLRGEAVDDHVDGVLLLPAEVRRLGELDDLSVDPRAGVALDVELAEELGELSLAVADEGGQDLEAGAVGKLEDLVDDVLWRLA